MADLVQALKKRGLRLTPQRQLILEAIEASDGHISAESVHAKVAAQFPQVNISTVYRTLELLQDLGLVSHTHFDDGIAQYHLASEAHHQHMVCRRCGSEQEIDVIELDPLDRHLRQRYGFRADLAHFAIIGTCAACVAIAERAAEQTDRLGRFLTEADGERLFAEAENFARRQPWVVAGVGLLAGMVVARALKASSVRRYDTTYPRAASIGVQTAGNGQAATYVDQPTQPLVPSSTTGGLP